MITSPVSLFGKAFFKKSLETGPTGTFIRLCTSEHLQDLQWIASFAIMAWAVGVAPLFLYFLLVAYRWFADALHGGLVAALMQIFSLGGGITAALAAILNWVYQTGSNRLGAIDLFGCEISVICRVCLVVDFAKSSVARLADAKMKSPAVQPQVASSEEEKPKQFTSAENYTPVYDENLSAIQFLDAVVVTSVTEFYTYRKTMLDYLRQIPEQPPGSEKYKQSTRQMIYMQFLMYESGRKAVERLIEFEPNKAESRINIFCSELIVYSCLLGVYTEPGRQSAGDDEYLLKRLQLREVPYKKDIPELYSEVKRKYEAGDDPHWQRAGTTADEMWKRFSTAFPKIPKLPDRAPPS